MTTIPAWLVKFDCGHTRHPERCYHDYATENESPPHPGHDGPPPIGWAGWCKACSDYRTTVGVVC